MDQEALVVGVDWNWSTVWTRKTGSNWSTGSGRLVVEVDWNWSSVWIRKTGTGALVEVDWNWSTGTGSGRELEH